MKNIVTNAAQTISILRLKVLYARS
jgi:hypothetical protein